MADVNHVVLIGRCTRDAANTPAAWFAEDFSLAVNRKKKSGVTWVDKASIFDVTCFGKRENCGILAQYMTKGKTGRR